MNADTLAPLLYARYTANSGGLNYRGEPCPTWFELPAAIRGHWRAVAEEAIDQVRTAEVEPA